MKTALLQYYSDNSAMLCSYTLKNHFKYANKQGYDIAFVKRPYSMYPNFNDIAKLMEQYDVVVTIGSDCLFTDLTRPLHIYAENYFNICEEGSNMSRLNGEMLFFRNFHDGKTYDYLDAMEKACQPGKEKFGFQTTCNNNIDNWSFATIIPVQMRIQSHDVYFPSSNQWKDGDIVMHALSNNKDKLARIQEFVQQHNMEDLT